MSNKTKSSNDSKLEKNQKTKRERVAGRRNARKSSDYARESQDTSKFAGVTTNDPSWYTNNPVLSRDVGNIFFSRPTGAPLFPNIIGQRKRGCNDPGIMVLRSMLTWGGSTFTDDGTGSALRESVAGSPMNLTATKLYQFVVHANSRNVSYDKKDLLMTMMAIDGVWQSISEAIRAYRLIAQYDVTNMYMSKLLAAAGWNVDDLKDKVAEFRYFINYAITRINKFFVPDLFDMWKAHVSAYTNIYLDQPTPKAQYIMRVPKGFWLYNDEEGCLEYMSQYTFPTATVATDYTHNPGSMTVKMFKDMIDLQISHIEDSQYIGIIQGDLLKAFGFEHMAKFNYIDIDMPIYPVFDEEFIFKFHNANWLGSFDAIYVPADESYQARAIYRDTDEVDGNIECILPSGTGVSGRSTFGSIYIDLPDGMDSDPAKVLLMSLYKLSGGVGGTSKWKLSDTESTNVTRRDLMPEVLLDMLIFTSPVTMDVYGIDMNTRIPTTRGTSLDSVLNPPTNLWALDRFKHTPAVLYNIYDPSLAENSTQLALPFWEIDNVAEISEMQLHRINTIILWSLWSSSVIASTTGV